MKSFKIIITTVLIGFISFHGHSQTKAFSEVHIGESLPTLSVHGLMADTSKQVDLAALHHGKMLILDFWATWCTPCISELKRLDAIKKRFPESVEIIAVAYQNYQTVTEFFNKHPESKPQNYQVLTNDKFLTYQLFPHRGIPHLVWIDPSGKVLSITNGEDVTIENVGQAIAKGKVTARFKIDNMKYRMSMPFHLRDSSFLSRSIYTDRATGVQSGFNYTFDTPAVSHRIRRIFACNVSIRQMYFEAVFRQRIFEHNYSRMLFEVNDSLKYMQTIYAPESFKKTSYYPDKSEWAQQNLHCYELQMPSSKPDTTMYAYMVQDLNRYLNLNGRYEKRELNCYVLKYKFEAEKQLIASKAQPKIVIKNLTATFMIAQNITSLTDVLNGKLDKGFIVNETGIDPKYLFDFDLEGLAQPSTAVLMNMKLAAYGLKLVEEKRAVPVFVVSEREL